jgi:hypothetical protein
VPELLGHRRELPDLVRVPVRVLSCRNPGLGESYPTLSASVRACATPALGVQRRDGSIRWWPGLSGALPVLPLVRRGGLREAAELLWTALRVRRRR